MAYSNTDQSLYEMPNIELEEQIAVYELPNAVPAYTAQTPTKTSTPLSKPIPNVKHIAVQDNDQLEAHLKRIKCCHYFFGIIVFFFLVVLILNVAFIYLIAAKLMPEEEEQQVVTSASAGMTLQSINEMLNGINEVLNLTLNVSSGLTLASLQS